MAASRVVVSGVARACGTVAQRLSDLIHGDFAPEAERRKNLTAQLRALPRLFDQFERLVANAYRLVSECPCREGCPSCVQSPKCGNLNEPLSKAGAAEVMARMLQH